LLINMTGINSQTISIRWQDTRMALILSAFSGVFDKLVHSDYCAMFCCSMPDFCSFYWSSEVSPKFYRSKVNHMWKINQRLGMGKNVIKKWVNGN
jgi:hypothetical protein